MRSRYVVDGYTVGLRCRGHGRVPVVFEAGGGSGGVIWTAGGIIPALGPNVFTCVFDRPGLVYDTVVPAAPVPEVLSPRSIATILVKTLGQAHIGPRVVLVGHSIGGMNAVEFGAAFPDRVAGAVLLDPSSPAALTDAVNRPAFVRYGIDPDAAAAEMRAVMRWPPVPLVVLTQDVTKVVAAGAWRPAVARAWRDWHRRYARLSSHGVERMVPRAAHDDFVLPGIARDAVLAAIREVLRRAH